jgi:hypothetical protein
MTYLEYLAAYNTLKKPLLIKSMAIHNISQLCPGDQELFFTSAFTYNLKLTAEENFKLKLAVAKKINYLGPIKFGSLDKKTNIVFCWKSRDAHAIITEYSQMGLITKYKTTRFRYELLKDTYRQYSYVGIVLFHTGLYTYNYDLHAELQYIYNNNLNWFKDNISGITSGTNSVVLNFKTNAPSKADIYGIIPVEHYRDISITETGVNICLK